MTCIYSLFPFPCNECDLYERVDLIYHVHRAYLRQALNETGYTIFPDVPLGISVI